MANVYKINLLRQLVRELKFLTAKNAVSAKPMYNFIMENYRRYQVTDKKYCKGEHEMVHLGETYLCLLRSNRKYEELTKMYSKSDKTIEQAARTVGLELPKTHQ